MQVQKWHSSLTASYFPTMHSSLKSKTGVFTEEMTACEFTGIALCQITPTLVFTDKQIENSPHFIKDSFRK